MLLSFCDLCKDTCPATPTRRWEHIQGELGLEVVVLKKDKPVGDTHICDKCILNMFYVMLERSPNSGIRQQRNALASREYQCKLIESELFKRELAVKELSQKVITQQQDVKDREAALSDKQGILEELKQSKVVVEAMRLREAEVIRLAEARGKQRAIDEFENPEYVRSIELRDYKRRNGLP